MEASVPCTWLWLMVIFAWSSWAWTGVGLSTRERPRRQTVANMILFMILFLSEGCRVGEKPLEHVDDVGGHLLLARPH